LYFRKLTLAAVWRMNQGHKLVQKEQLESCFRNKESEWR
jgi:hypothetical protein